jgi:ATP adenylyltransferase
VTSEVDGGGPGLDVESPDDFARAEDGFQRLWTPHRMVYISGAERPRHEGAGRECPFCRAVGADDETALVVHRGTHAYAVLNLYPYNPGHLLVCPYEHLADYTDLSAAQREEIGTITATAMTVLRSVSGPHGFNLGMNQGSVAGAGIVGHLHQHVVPRWSGDSNFLPIVAGTKAVPELLADTRAKIAAAWRETADAAGQAVTPEGT